MNERGGTAAGRRASSGGRAGRSGCPGWQEWEHVRRGGGRSADEVGDGQRDGRAHSRSPGRGYPHVGAIRDHLFTALRPSGLGIDGPFACGGKEGGVKGDPEAWIRRLPVRGEPDGRAASKAAECRAGGAPFRSRRPARRSTLSVIEEPLVPARRRGIDPSRCSRNVRRRSCRDSRSRRLCRRRGSGSATRCPSSASEARLNPSHRRSVTSCEAGGGRGLFMLPCGAVPPRRPSVVSTVL